jgi:hypothetical protein
VSAATGHAEHNMPCTSQPGSPAALCPRLGGRHFTLRRDCLCRALRRKVGGTAKDYWKDWVDVQGSYTDKGYVSRQNATVPGVSTTVAAMASAGLLMCRHLVKNCNPDIVNMCSTMRRCELMMYVCRASVPCRRGRSNAGRGCICCGADLIRAVDAAAGICCWCWLIWLGHQW